MNEVERADFEQAVGECFADAVSPPVPFEAASAHECFEAVAAAFPRSVQPADFAVLRPEQLGRLARSFADYFDCPPPADEQLAAAAKALLRRWPASSS